jgi:DUF1365 family protein
MIDQKNSTLLAIAFFLLSVVVLFFLLFIVFPLISAFLATCLAYTYHISSTRNRNEGGKFGPSMINSALYTGRVWHTRLHPKKHAFTYPIFMFALDLEELDAFRNTLWPLSTWLVKFREIDHLKNGEGIMGNNNQDRSRSSSQSHENKTNKNSADANANANNNDNGNDSNINGTTDVLERTPIGDRIMLLVAQKTLNKFQPTLQTHRVMILTHLCYYGYNFNPVSFYYIIDKKSNNNHDIAAIVGEVSNTPWLQQYCYVLHPDSIDKVKTKIQHDDHDDEQMKKKVEYSFPKAFHVSPFMEMDYFYDWSFIGIPGAAITSDSTSDTNTTNIKSSKSITVVNTLRRRNNNRIEFTAKLIMESNPITPFRVAQQIIIFPVYCMIIQIWIHYQAVLLFLKGVVYIPHPLGSETAASVIIAKIMIPFFAIQDYFKPKTKTA